jgi:hypothetical protein
VGSEWDGKPSTAAGMTTSRHKSEAEPKRPASALENRDALKIKEIESTAAGIKAELVHKQFIESFGG